MAVFITLFTACKKNDEAAQLDVTTTNIAGVYKITADVEVEGGVTFDRFNGGTISGVAYTSDYETCEKDDTFTFTTTTVTNAEGATSCSPATTSVSAPYTVNTSAKTLTALGITGTITSLTANTMVIQYTSTFMGVTNVQTKTFSK